MSAQTPPQPEPESARAPVVWTPEAAANFLSAAIKESQRPLADALKRQGIPSWAFGLVVLVAVAIVVLGWLYFDQQLQQAWHTQASQATELRLARGRLEKSLGDQAAKIDALRSEAATALAARGRAEGELAGLKSHAATLEKQVATSKEAVNSLRRQLDSAMTSSTERIKMLQADYETLLLKANKNRGGSDLLRQKLEEVDSAKDMAQKRVDALTKELTTANKKVELLKLQIQGLEDEKRALRTQLDATQALLKTEGKQVGTPAPEPAKETQP